MGREALSLRRVEVDQSVVDHDADRKVDVGQRTPERIALLRLLAGLADQPAHVPGVETPDVEPPHEQPRETPVELEPVDPKTNKSQTHALPGGKAYSLSTVARFLGWIKPSTEGP